MHIDPQSWFKMQKNLKGIKCSVGFAKTRKLQTRVLPAENFETRVRPGFLQNIIVMLIVGNN